MMDLSKLAVCERRHVLATLARAHPGIHFYSDQLVQGVNAHHAVQIRKCLIAVASEALYNVQPGHMITHEFQGLTFEDTHQGDWQVTVDHVQSFDCLVTPHEFDPTSLMQNREWLSEQVNLTPDTVYVNTRILAKLPDKMLTQGDCVNAQAQAAMLLCSTCAQANLMHHVFHMVIIQCSDHMQGAAFDIHVQKQ